MSGYQQRRPAPGKQPIPPRLADYKTVGDRIDSFCADYPGETCITTTEVDGPADGWIAFRAIVSRRMPDGTEWVLGTGHAAQKFTGADDQYEKVETAARGRALVAAGYTSSLEKAAEIEEVNRQEGREPHRFTPHADNDGLIPHQLPQDAPNAPVTPEPLTPLQQQTVADAWSMAESDTIGAVKALLLTLKPHATPGQWRTISAEAAKITRKFTEVPA